MLNLALPYDVPVDPRDYDAARDGNRFAWILRQAAAARAGQHAQRDADHAIRDARASANRPFRDYPVIVGGSSRG